MYTQDLILNMSISHTKSRFVSNKTFCNTFPVLFKLFWARILRCPFVHFFFKKKGNSAGNCRKDMCFENFSDSFT